MNKTAVLRLSDLLEAQAQTHMQQSLLALLPFGGLHMVGQMRQS
jgi:hypothetical protein